MTELANEMRSEPVLLSLVADAGQREINRVLERSTVNSHIVQFYDDHAFLVDQVATYLSEGFAADSAAIVIATPPHRTALESRLIELGFDAAYLARTGALVFFDAEETLAQLLVDDQPDWTAFEQIVGGLVSRTARLRPGTLRAYGEMVDVLWKRGNRTAALALEQMWNQLAGAHGFALFCAYGLEDFTSTADTEAFAAVCRAHTHVVPSGTRTALETEDRSREIATLQQRARSLESEIEQRKHLEAALRDALLNERVVRAEAERAVRFNEMFAGMLGHDLRNPLGAISTAATYIVRANADAHTTTAAGRIVSSAERMGRMIEQLLDFTRIRVAGGLALRRARVNLAELCFRIKDELEAAHPECAILVSASGDSFGEWDHDRLLQVLSNLTGNAIRHGTEGCDVRIRADGRDREWVTVSVHNMGAITAEALPELFEPFRGTTTYHTARGLGLGLYISRQIVEVHGGTIDVASNATDGTTFSVKLPRRPPPQQPAV